MIWCSAYWVWNDAAENTITFQFRFSLVVDAEAEAEGDLEMLPAPPQNLEVVRSNAAEQPS